MDVIHSNTNEIMTISIKGNVTKRMPKNGFAANHLSVFIIKTLLNAFNNQVEFQWIRLGLAAKWDKAVQPALRLATVQVAFLKSAFRDHHDHNCFCADMILFLTLSHPISCTSS